ncbi:energy-coupling factor ABC transporter ATP-binding protein [Methanomethylovorans sp.]|uniref:energy-coupling factor ABC transporter ATP-binding protein n=1 Tax=Methanomethylovorans sp. TaxID=2758717 RepID=UPI00345E0FE2
MTILETRDLVYSYPDGTIALDNVNVRIEMGRKIAFVGRNGSGKSTLFLTLNGTLTPKNGKVLFHDRPVKYDAKSLRELRKNVGIVFQNSDDQLFAPSVYQDVAFGPTNLGYSKEKVNSVVQSALDYVGLNPLKKKPPHHLSGGQKKRVAIAGIVAMEPEVIILDEPLSNLDPVGADEVMDLLNELNYFGKTIIISTHDVDLAYRWADHVFIMTDHQVIGEGIPEDIFRNEELLQKANLRKPLILEVHEELRRRSLVKENGCPKDIPGLVRTLKEPELMWVKVSPDVKTGDSLNLGLLHGEFALNYPMEAVNGKVLHIHENCMAIVELSRHYVRAGSIMIYDTDHHDTGFLKLFISNSDVDTVGAMGKRSKLIAERDNIRLDITSGVIDRSILNALRGQRCLIITHGGMVHHALERIGHYIEESGINIHVDIINENGNISSLATACTGLASYSQSVEKHQGLKDD